MKTCDRCGRKVPEELILWIGCKWCVPQMRKKNGQKNEKTFKDCEE